MTADAALREIALGSGPIALVTVARVEGSAPRHVGSRMAVRPDGRTFGTVGGGQPEARAIATALACLAEGQSGALRVEMAGTEATGADLICGGLAEMWIEVVADPSPYAAALAAVERGEVAIIVASADKGCLAIVGPETSVTKLWDKAALDLVRKSGQCTISEVDGFLYSPLEPRERLLILGGGHVGLALSRVAVELSFQVTVADPRPEYSMPARFPAGIACLTSPFVDAIQGFPSGQSSYVVIVSPGHLGDLECARSLLRGDYRYIGLIGSRRKSRMLIEELAAEGFPKDRAAALRSPIGLAIGAETPEEIAIAIAAELIAVRRKSAALDIFDADRIKRRDKPRSG